MPAAALWHSIGSRTPAHEFRPDPGTTASASRGSAPGRNGDRPARRRGRSFRSLSLGQRGGPARCRPDGLHDPAGLRRQRRQLPRRRDRHRGDGARLRRDRPHRGRGQHGRDLCGDALRQRGAAPTGRRVGAGRRQAGDLHHRAGGRLRRHRDDHAGRPPLRPLRDQRSETLDHRRRRLPPAPDLRPRVRRERQRAGHRRLPGGARPGGRNTSKAWRSDAASRRWGCAASRRPN